MSRPKRLANHSYVGHFHYFLTFCAWKRRPIFEDAAVVAETVAQIQRTAAEELFAVLAYCFMPDHLHLLVKGFDDESDLRRFVKRTKQAAGYAYKQRGHERLWQEGYFDRVLRDESEARSCAQYIVNNPVRDGLVARARDYAYLGSSGWSLDELTKDALDNEAFPTRQAPGLEGPAYTTLPCDLARSRLAHSVGRAFRPGVRVSRRLRR
jgi:putative transposase